jgi:hypothetical protein
MFFPLVGVHTVPSKIYQMVGDNTSHRAMILEINTCVLLLSSALSSGVVRARILFNNKYKIALSYFLRQGLFYLSLCYMVADSPAKGPLPLKNNRPCFPTQKKF